MDLSEFSRLEDKSSYSRHPWEISRKKALFSILKTSEITFPVKRIVDIGSGDAFVIHALATKNMAQEYFAIDTAYTPEVISRLKQNNDNSNVIYLQNLKQYFDEYPSEKQSLFLCMDVLEHLKNEREILDELQSKGNDYFYFAVPAFQSVFSGHDVLLGHYRRYTLNQLEVLLSANNFTIADKGYYFLSLLIFRKADGIFNKNKKASIDNWKGGKAKSAIFITVLNIDFIIGLLFKKLGINIPGLSCYCLCKK